MNIRFIRCWDAKTSHEIYRITVGLGGLGSGHELCIWSLLALRFKMNLFRQSLVYYKLHMLVVDVLHVLTTATFFF